MVIDDVEHIQFILEVRLGLDPPSSMSMLPDYIPPRLVDAPKIKIDKNEKYLIVKPTISTGF